MSENEVKRTTLALSPDSGLVQVSIRHNGNRTAVIISGNSIELATWDWQLIARYILTS
jgi:hypothetical protein